MTKEVKYKPIENGRVSEVNMVLNKMEKVEDTVSGWGVNQYMILKTNNKLEEGLRLLTSIQTHLAVFRARMEKLEGS
jgi:hypothetical protein